MNQQLIDQLQQIGIQLNANGLPYPIPIHPNLVHLTLGCSLLPLFLTSPERYSP